MNKEIKGIRIQQGVSIGECESYYIDVHYGFDKKGKARFTNYMVAKFSNGSFNYRQYDKHYLKARFNKSNDEGFIVMDGHRMNIADFKPVGYYKDNEIVQALLNNMDKVKVV